MHSLLDRSTILAGLVDELRPLLPPLGGALGDLCAGFGRAEAAEQALETAFMIRAAAEMLELEALAEAGGLIETVVPILHDGSPDLLKESRPVVQALVAAVEQATNALLRGNERPDEALAAARSGVARLQELRGQQVQAGRGQTPDLEAMLATLPDVPEFGRPRVEEETPYVDAVAAAEAAGDSLSPWAAQLAPPGSLPEPVWDESADELPAEASAGEPAAGFGDFDLLSFLELADAKEPTLADPDPVSPEPVAPAPTGDLTYDLPAADSISTEPAAAAEGERSFEPAGGFGEPAETATPPWAEPAWTDQPSPTAAIEDGSDAEVTMVEPPIADLSELTVAESVQADPIQEAPFEARLIENEPTEAEQWERVADKLTSADEAPEGPAGPATPEWRHIAQPPAERPASRNGHGALPPIESAGLFSRFIQNLRNGSNAHVADPRTLAPAPEPSTGDSPVPSEWLSEPAAALPTPPAEAPAEPTHLPVGEVEAAEAAPAWQETQPGMAEPWTWSPDLGASPSEATAQPDEIEPTEAIEQPAVAEAALAADSPLPTTEWVEWTREPAVAPVDDAWARQPAAESVEDPAQLSEQLWAEWYGAPVEHETAMSRPDDAVATESAATPVQPETMQSMPEIDPEILEVFMIEAEEVMGSIRGRLTAVQIDPNDRSSGTELRRACHTLKGAANVVGFTSIGLIAKSMEDLLDALADAEARPDEAALSFLEGGYRTVRALIEHPGRPELLEAVATLQAEGQTLALAAGVTPELASQTEDSAETDAWEQAVEAFLADAEAVETAPDGDAEPAADDVVVPTEAFTPVEPLPYEPVAVAHEATVDDANQAELVAIFAGEAEEHLTALSGVALRLDLSPNDGNAQAEALRTLHTLKGAAGALGLEMISGLCHETESRLETEGPETAARLLFEAAETLEQMVRGLAATGRETAVTLPEPLAQASLLPIEPELAAGPPMTEETWRAEPEATAPVGEPSEREPVAGPATVQTGPALEPEDVPANSGSVRIDLGRVDELMNVVGELVLSRSSLEQRLDRVGRSAEELRLTVARLRRVAQYLEDRYEVAELIRTTPQDPLHGEFDELEMDRYTELHRVSREVAELAADAETTSDELDLSLKELDALTVRQARLGSDLQDKLMAVRLVPLSTITTRLHRTVRSVALKQGKEVDFILQGGETELDKRVIEELGDVLLHLIRNAVDHGLEAPEERERLGKSRTGALTLRAFREGSEAIIQVGDDGTGVSLERLRQRAELLGLLRGGQDLDEQELLDLIFQPGVTTSTVASEVSGRGVGLDVVRTAVRRLKGSIEVSSRAGEGTTFTLRLPVVLAVVQAMLVEAGEQPYAIPMAAIERVVQTEAQPTIQLGRTPMIELDGETFPFAELAMVLGRTASPRLGERRSILVVRAGERRIAVAVDAMLDQQEVVVKSLGSHLRAVRGVLGATIRTNGELLLVLNTAELLTTRALVLGGRASRATPGGLTAGGALRALVVDDSLSVRKVLARALERDGWEVRQARDGVDALEVLQGYQPNVVLMDIEMPRMDGFELAGILREVGEYGRPPVVMITSRAGEKHRQRAAELDVAGYVVKPYQEPELLAMLRQVALTGSRR